MYTRRVNTYIMMDIIVDGIIIIAGGLLLHSNYTSLLYKFKNYKS